jgi:hypothetical protein
VLLPPVPVVDVLPPVPGAMVLPPVPGEVVLPPVPGVVVLPPVALEVVFPPVEVAVFPPLAVPVDPPLAVAPPVPAFGLGETLSVLQPMRKTMRTSVIFFTEGSYHRRSESRQGSGKWEKKDQRHLRVD